ncbi:MAG TPA: OmpA family protein [Treponemataceae bacterium]|nr:OmpA family protein [Treponemataceae bacterium]HPS44948.1 OmpA family protein [Treponemataceae bacterium]
MITKSTGIAILALFALTTASAETLTWKAVTGQQYETKTTVQESVTGPETVQAKKPQSATATMSQEDAAARQSTIAWLEGIPSFPRSSVEAGATWQSNGTVSYDLSAFGYEEPLKVRVPVSYTFLGLSESENRTYYHIRAEWYPLTILPKSIAKRTGVTRLSGHSVLDLYWDNRSGSPKRSALTEEIQYRFDDASSLLLTRDTAEDIKTVTDIVRERDIKQLSSQITSKKVANVEVKQADEGIVLSIENIQFEAESAVLTEAEKTKLTNIGNILSGLKNRRLSIVGHAANPAGADEKELLSLSAERAKAVADFLVASGFRTADTIVTSGMGGAKPIASNDTAEGRSKNRRVEIVIMDEGVER